MAKDRLTSIKNRLIGDDPATGAIANELINGILYEYGELYSNIAGKLATARSHVSYISTRGQGELIAKISKTVKSFEDKANSLFARYIKSAAKNASRNAINDTYAFGGKPKSKTWHYELNEDFIRSTIEGASDFVKAQSDRIIKSIKDMIKKEAIEIVRRASLEGVSSRTAHKRSLGYIATLTPDLYFADKAGRRWDSKVYFDMLSKTVMRQASNDAYLNSAVAEGYDLVKVSTIGSKDECRFWEGKILSITGRTKGYRTLLDAKESRQIFHPRCKHTVVMYDSSIDKI